LQIIARSQPCCSTPSFTEMLLLTTVYIAGLLVGQPQRIHQPAGFVGRTHGSAVATATTKYGVDPRSPFQLATARDSLRFRLGKGAGLEELRIAPGRIGVLHNVEELAAAVAAASTDRFVCIKFWRDGCPACASTVERFAALAERHTSGDFFLVNFDTSKPLCKLCRLGVIPTAHIYAQGALVDAMGLGKSSWDPFARRVDEVAATLASDTHETDGGSLLSSV